MAAFLVQRFHETDHIQSVDWAGDPAAGPISMAVPMMCIAMSPETLQGLPDQSIRPELSGDPERFEGARQHFLDEGVFQCVALVLLWRRTS